MAFSPLKWVKVGDQVQRAGLTDCRGSLPAAFPDEEACGFGPEICRGGDTIQQQGEVTARRQRPSRYSIQNSGCGVGRGVVHLPPLPLPPPPPPLLDARREITDISRLVFVSNSTLAGLLVQSLTLKCVRFVTKPSEISKPPMDSGCQGLLEADNDAGLVILRRNRMACTFKIKQSYRGTKDPILREKSDLVLVFEFPPSTKSVRRPRFQKN